MKYNLYYILAFFILIILSSCGRRGMPQTDPMYPHPGYFNQGFFYGNHFYDPRFYNFIPRGNRVIIVDNRTNEQVAAPRRRNIRVAQDTDARTGQQPQVGNERRRPADTRRGEQTSPERRSRREADSQRQQQRRTQERTQPGRTQERTAPAPSQRRTAPAPSQPQQRSGSEGQSPRGSRRGG